MKVCLFLEAQNLLVTSGIKTAYDNHLQALRKSDVRVTTDPGEDYDILHLHWFGPKSLYRLAMAHRSGCPVVVSTHSVGAYDLTDSFVLSNALAPIHEKYLDFYYRHADQLVAPTPYAKNLVQSRKLNPVTVVSNGVNRQKFSCSSSSGSNGGKPGNRLKLGEEKLTVMSAGNVVPRKGVPEFIRLARDLPEFDFVWFGERWNKLLVLKPSMHRQLDNSPSNLHLPGFTEQPHVDYRVGDVFCFPSRGEVQGAVILEAASLGMPLIVRDLPTYKQWLTHGENCLKASTTEEFQQALQAVSSDENLRHKLHQGALRLARQHSLNKVGKELQKVYQRVGDESA